MFAFECISKKSNETTYLIADKSTAFLGYNLEHIQVMLNQTNNAEFLSLGDMSWLKIHGIEVIPADEIIIGENGDIYYDSQKLHILNHTPFIYGKDE